MKAKFQQIMLFAGLCFLAHPDGIVSEASARPAAGQPIMEEPGKPEEPVWELLESPSFVPQQEESFIHIAGGFFSRFNRRFGAISQCRELLRPDFGSGSEYTEGGTIRFSLKSLGYRSSMVYLPAGSIELCTVDGDTRSFSMGVLDYVQIAGRDLPCYRLSATDELDISCTAVLVCAAIGTEMPLLIGTLYIVSNSGDDIKSYKVQIVGRNSVEAERHLLKVVEAVSHF
ncbi:MAG: hypothetical protein JSV89_19360 [Spirochaetaceae bacterium]|nr:MAG: hypothetical protein JSV89_19360 [Spirochaetaceae bacterium]